LTILYKWLSLPGYEIIAQEGYFCIFYFQQELNQSDLMSHLSEFKHIGDSLRSVSVTVTFSIGLLSVLYKSDMPFEAHCLLCTSASSLSF
jgi:hypothetical protein